MFNQNDGRLNENIRLYGCYLMSLIWYGNHFTNLAVSADLINKLYVLFQKHGWMTETCFIKNPVAILDWMGVDAKSISKEGPNYQPRKNEFLIGQWKADSISHFVCMSNDKCVIYDPWFSKEGGSKAVREGELLSYRVFRR